jgi:enterochelin esterase-like enzyme
MTGKQRSPMSFRPGWQLALTAAGIEHLFRLYPGGHTVALWQTHAPAWLALAVDSLTGAPAL